MTFYEATVSVLLRRNDAKPQTREMVAYIGKDEVLGMRAQNITLQSGCLLTVARKSPSQIRIELLTWRLIVVIRKQGDALNVKLKLRRRECCGEIIGGLCGLCRDCPDDWTVKRNDQCPLQDEWHGTTIIETPMTVTPGNQITEYPLLPQDGIVDVLPDDPQDVLDDKLEGAIVPGEEYPADIPEGGIVHHLPGFRSGECVCFKQSGIIARKLEMFQERYTTMELYVRTCSDPICHGTILSYSLANTLAILHQDTLQIAFSDSIVLDTQQGLEHNHWQLLVIVLDNYKFLGYFYVFDHNGEPTRHIFNFPVGLQTGGNLGLGRWQPPGNGAFLALTDKFEGCIDDLKIWNRDFGLYELLNHWGMVVTGEEEGLQFWWTFDAIQGTCLIIVTTIAFDLRVTCKLIKYDSKVHWTSLEEPPRRLIGNGF